MKTFPVKVCGGHLEACPHLRESRRVPLLRPPRGCRLPPLWRGVSRSHAEHRLPSLSALEAAQTHAPPPSAQTHAPPPSAQTHAPPPSTQTHAPSPPSQTHAPPPSAQTHVPLPSAQTHAPPPPSRTHAPPPPHPTPAPPPPNRHRRTALAQTHAPPPSAPPGTRLLPDPGAGAQAEAASVPSQSGPSIF